MISYLKSKINIEICSKYVLESTETTPNVVRQLNDTASKEKNLFVSLFPAVLSFGWLKKILYLWLIYVVMSHSSLHSTENLSHFTAYFCQFHLQQDENSSLITEIKEKKLKVLKWT